MNDRVTPSKGVTDYYIDKTQGPICSIACGAGTVYRNYSINNASDHPINGQINNASGLQEILGNKFIVKNGYTINNSEMPEKFKSIIINQREELLENLRIGIHKKVGITYTRGNGIPNNHYKYVGNEGKMVTQVFCSAMSFQNARKFKKSWLDLAGIILEATYEATIRSAYLRSIDTEPEPEMESTNKNKVYLTLVGGGVFLNEDIAIFNAIKKAIKIAQTENLGLDIILVDYEGKFKKYLSQWRDNLFREPIIFSSSDTQSIIKCKLKEVPIEIDNELFCNVYGLAKNGDFEEIFIKFNSDLRNFINYIPRESTSGYGFLAQAIFWVNISAILKLILDYNCSVCLPLKQRTIQEVKFVDINSTDEWDQAILQILANRLTHERKTHERETHERETHERFNRNEANQKIKELFQNISFLKNKYLKYKNKYLNYHP